MSQSLDRRVLLGSASNFRDLGGLPVAGGSMRRGEVFRSATLSRLSDEDLPAFEGLGIGIVYDFRTAAESEAEPDRLPGSTLGMVLDVLADGTAGVAHAIGRLRTDPGIVNELLGSGNIDAMLMQSYREFVTIDSANRAYRSFFEGLADSQRSGAALFHCTAGKDRTGWAAATLLTVLGADDETVRADYLQTNTDFLPSLEPLLQSAAVKGVDVDLLREAFSVKNEYLDTALGEVEDRFGTVENYLVRGVGVESKTLDALRERFIV